MVPPLDVEDFELIQVPETTSSPPFRVTCASHLVYTVRDLSRSRDFYTEVLGLVVSDEDPKSAVSARCRGTVSPQPRAEAYRLGCEERSGPAFGRLMIKTLIERKPTSRERG